MTPPTPDGDRLAQTGVSAGRDVIGTQHTHHHQGPTSPTALFAAPPPPPRFTGRTRELTALVHRLDPRRDSQAVVVSALAGMGGIGKTALAAHAAATAAEHDWFCAHLWIDLHGYTPHTPPVTAEAALDTLLRALGTRPDDIPLGLQERAAAYRSALQELSRTDPHARPVLVVADNARDPAQVRPLLPGPGGHRLVATARTGLAELAGAHHLDLDVLAEPDALALLAAELSTHTPDDPRSHDEAGLERLARCCGHLPLALEVTAAHLKRSPHLAPGRLVQRLESASSLLRELSDRDRAVRTVFDTSLATLETTQARVFLLLGSAPGPSTSTAAVAVLTGLEFEEAAEVLEELATARLLTRPAPDRWAMHDLAADYARNHPDPPADREPALTRLLDAYTDTVDAADDHLRALPGQGVPDAFDDRQEAMAWLDEEHATLIEAVRTAQATGHTRAAVHLPLNLARYLEHRRRFTEWEQISRIAQEVAHASGDTQNEAAAWNSLGLALRETRRFDEAIDAHTHARTLHQDIGDTHGQAMAWTNLGTALRQVRRFDDAINAHTHARTLHQEVGDTHREASAWNNLGTALQEVRRFDEAIDAHTHALSYYQDIGDPHSEAGAWNNLGLALRQVRRFDAAINAYTHARNTFQHTGDTHREATAWNNLGVVLPTCAASRKPSTPTPTPAPSTKKPATPTAKPTPGTTSAAPS
ncbi:tetratricopeptide repeat protein [Streptomonospora salina]|uniref:Tetratricopeptide (TPR) repeat protein n=1 Tax=Streptomonospora salina TaxID=104205 RepID=A0A841ELB5_9ACTN|nr:tetratricopeptide repeat protein [Streptomonospora salina]MBB6000191.1 tetratricopeptide (TPR) repeat protein [Streptomonospora salina]